VAKAEFFPPLAHLLRIHILEPLRDGPVKVGSPRTMIGVPASSLSRQLTYLRTHSILTDERQGKVVLDAVAERGVLQPLDDARAILAAHVSQQAVLASEPAAMSGAR
jgi:DNA-binding transcriptional ArsR family regulator